MKHMLFVILMKDGNDNFVMLRLLHILMSGSYMFF